MIRSTKARLGEPYSVVDVVLLEVVVVEEVVVVTAAMQLPWFTGFFTLKSVEPLFVIWAGGANWTL